MRKGLVATTLMVTASLTLLAGCSADEDPAKVDPAQVAAPSPPSQATGTGTGAADAGPTNPLSGAYVTPPLTVSHMARVAHQAGYETADIDEYLAGLRAVQQVTYTLRLTDDLWVVFESRDGAAGEEVWSGPYQVLDESAVRAGGKPCGPITYDYNLATDELTLRMTDNQCYEADGHVPAGELIAQTTIYHSAPFHRIG